MPQKKKNSNQSQFNTLTIGVIAITFVIGFFLGAQYNLSRKEHFVQKKQGDKGSQIRNNSWVEYSSPQIDYTIRYPGGWNVVDDLEEEGMNRQQRIIVENQRTDFKKLPEKDGDEPHVYLSYFFAIGPKLLPGPTSDNDTYYEVLMEGQTLLQYVQSDLNLRSDNFTTESINIQDRDAVISWDKTGENLMITMLTPDKRIFRVDVNTNAVDDSRFSAGDYKDFLIQAAQNVSFK